MRWTRHSLYSDAERRTGQNALELGVIDGTLAGLRGEGVVRMEDGSAWASDAARRLDELDLICV